MSDSDNPYAKPSAWGRPPQQPFKIGPLPKTDGPPLQPPPAPRRTRGASSIVSGGAQPARAPTAPVPPIRTETPEPVAPQAVAPEAIAATPTPEPAKVAAVQPPVAEPELAFAPAPRTTAPRPSRTPLIVGGAVATVAVVGVGAFMLMNRTAPATTDAPSAGLAIETQVPVTSPPSASTPLAVLPETQRATTTSEPPQVAASVERASAEPLAKPAAEPTREARVPAAVSPPPVLAVETAPLVIPEPTPIPIAPAGPPPPAAERPSTDPSAPMTTRLPDGTD